MSTTDTLKRLPEIKARIEALPWPAPWTAHTFEIDCPCPNGSHCGDYHTCEEVEARESYPASPEEPAAEGRGQCIVQITTPGLEMFAKPCAEFIANARVDMPDLVAAVEEMAANLDVAICTWCGHRGSKDPEAMVDHAMGCVPWKEAALGAMSPALLEQIVALEGEKEAIVQSSERAFAAVKELRAEVDRLKNELSERDYCDICGDGAEQLKAKSYGEVEVCRMCWMSQKHGADLIAEERDRLRAALAYYADAKTYEGHAVGHEWAAPIESDKGLRASDALDRTK